MCFSFPISKGDNILIILQSMLNELLPKKARNTDISLL